MTSIPLQQRKMKMNTKPSTVRTLSADELQAVSGGQQTAAETDRLIERNTQRAIDTSGKGNVAEVTDKGFKCK